MTKSVDIYFAKPGWQSSMEEELIKYVLVERETYISAVLRQTQDWHLMDKDDVSVLNGRN